MASTKQRPQRRNRGHIETLRSGAKRIRVSSGRDPITKKQIYAGETVPASMPDLNEAADRVLTKWLKKVDDGKAPRTNATVDELIDAYFDVIDIDRAIMRGWRSKQKNTSVRCWARPRSRRRTRRSTSGSSRGCGGARKHCDRRPQTDHRTPRQHDCDDRCVPHECEGLSASMMREIHTILKGACARAVVWEWLGSNPLDQVQPPEAPKPNPQPPKAHEAAQLINKAWRNDPCWGTCVWTAFTTGKRRSDLCGLRFSGLDLESGVAEFGLAIKQDGTEIYTGEPKGKRHTRVVLDPETVEVLREHLNRCTALAAATGVALDPEGYVFSDAIDHSTPWRPAAVTQRFGRLRDTLGLKTSLHKTRHYSATELIIAGVDVAHSRRPAGPRQRLHHPELLHGLGVRGRPASGEGVGSPPA